MKEFLAFLKHYGVIGLAIAVILGGKLNGLVTTLVNDLITPVLLTPALRAAGVLTIADLQWSGIMYGKVIAALLDFLIVAFLVFVFSKKILREEIVAKK